MAASLKQKEIKYCQQNFFPASVFWAKSLSAQSLGVCVGVGVCVCVCVSRFCCALKQKSTEAAVLSIRQCLGNAKEKSELEAGQEIEIVAQSWRAGAGVQVSESRVFVHHLINVIE